MVRKEIHFQVVEGNFDKYISLSDSIDEIIESFDGRCFSRVISKKDQTSIVKIKFKNSTAMDNTIISVTKLLFENGLKEKVLSSKDLVLRELAEAAGVA
jgi:predicted ribonuclease YlaK